MHKDQKILITGATGFVGAYLLRYLLKYGYHNIRAIRRANSPMGLVNDIADQVEWAEGDILDVPFLEEVMQGVEQLYHCAAVVSHDSKDASWMTEVNVTGTANVVNIALHPGIKKLLHISSIAAIGRVKNMPIISEASKWQRSPLNSDYGISKYQAEQEVWRGIAEGLTAVIINPGIILGSGFWDRGTGQFFTKVANRLRFHPIGGSGFVDVRDVARMSIQLMESNIAAERFLAISENLSYQEVFDSIADCMDMPRPGIRVSPWMAGIAWRAAALAAPFRGGRSPLPKATAMLTTRTFFYENDKSLEQLGYNYIPVSKTIAETCRQYHKAITTGQKYEVLDLE